jgi:hypothetical protein
LDPDALEGVGKGPGPAARTRVGDDAYSTFAGGAFTMLDSTARRCRHHVRARDGFPSTRAVDVDFDRGTGTYLDLATSGFARRVGTCRS